MKKDIIAVKNRYNHIVLHNGSHHIEYKQSLYNNILSKLNIV